MHQDIKAALPVKARMHHTHTQDVSEHSHAMTGWALHYDQVSSGRFEGELIDIQLDWMHLTRDRCNQALRKNGSAWPGAITFSLPLNEACELHCAGHSLREASLLVARGAHLPELQTPANLDLLCITVAEAELLPKLEQQQSPFTLDDLPKCYRLRPHQRYSEFVRLLDDIANTQSQSQGLLKHEAIRNGIRETVLLHLLDLLDAGEEVPALTPTARKRMVDRAREYALSCQETPPSILELCNRIGASRRKLQYCFQEALGVNPTTYLRTLRLNAAHRALCHSDDTVSVQDVAAQWGFWHLSRFANDYAKLFGEKPSATLRRVREDYMTSFAKSG